MDLSGIFVPTTTPFDERGEVDIEAFRENARSWLEFDVAGFVVGGSSGEAVLLDEDERIKLWKSAKAELGNHLLIAGTGAESLRASIRLAKAAADAGANALLVQPPAFFKGAMSRAALDAHYKALADASPIPVILYQVPLKFSTLDFENSWVAEISHYPNIVGIKDSRGKLNLVSELARTCAPDFQVLVGSGAILLDALNAGAVGGILGVANLMAGDCVEIYLGATRGKLEYAIEVQSRVAPVHNGVIGAMGVPGVKYCLDLLGFVGGSPRPPLHPLAEKLRPEAESLLVAAGAL